MFIFTLIIKWDYIYFIFLNLMCKFLYFSVSAMGPALFTVDSSEEIPKEGR